MRVHHFDCTRSFYTRRCSDNYFTCCLCDAGLISQNPVLFATTIRDNLLYGVSSPSAHGSTNNINLSPRDNDTLNINLKEVSIDIDMDTSGEGGDRGMAVEAKEGNQVHAPVGITQEALDVACKMANCYDFIHSFPEGYDTMVGERGVRLSGIVNGTTESLLLNALCFHVHTNHSTARFMSV